MTTTNNDEIAALAAWRVRNADTGENITLRQYIRLRYADDILAAELEIAQRYIKVQDDDTGQMMNFSDFVQSHVNGEENPVVLYEDAGSDRTLKVINSPAAEHKRRDILSLKQFAKMNSVKKD